MYAQVIDEVYDFAGRRIFTPSRKKHRVFHPTFAMGLFANSPLSVRCTSLEELRSFLKKCRYVSDQKQFDKDDFWMPPAAFERSRQGDCEDFALYAWRQLLEMGYESRFVAGYSGRYGSGHAWVTAEIDGKRYVVEPLARFMHKVPRLWLIRYEPEVSVEWDGKRIRYHAHEKREYNPSLRELVPLVFEWLAIVPAWWMRNIIMLGKYLALIPIRFLRMHFQTLKKNN